MRLSSRLPSERDLEPTRLARRLAAVTDAIDLTISNPTRCGFDYPVELIGRCLADPRAMVYEPAPLGLAETRAAIAAASRTGVAAEDVVVTASTSESYALLFKLLCAPGERLAVLTPGYPLLAHLARLEGLEVTGFGMYYTDDTGRWALDLGALEDALANEGVRAVLVVNPNNPTGSCPSQSERRAVRELCRAHDATLIADEVFGHFGHRRLPLPSLAPVGEEAQTGPLTVILDGLSKSGGLPQLKLGWMELFGPDALRARARVGLEWLADTYLSVGTPIQLAAPRLLPALVGVREQIKTRLVANRNTLAAALAGVPEIDLRPADGGWSAVLRVPRILSDADWVLALAEEHRVLVHPGFFFDFAWPGHLVLSLLPPTAEFEAGVARLTTGAAGVIHSK